MNPLISIIIPTYNRVFVIFETLKSIQRQTYENWECIVVDDGSTDDTEHKMQKLTEEDSRFSFYKRPANRIKGPCSCRNFGFTKAKGKYIQFFDSDDIYMPEAFEKYVASFKVEIDAVIGKINMVNVVTGSVTKQSKIVSNEIVKDHFLGKISFYVCGPMWRKTFLDNQEVLFNENLKNGDDWDFSMRMLYKNPNLKFLEDAYINYIKHPESLSKERIKLNKNELRLYFDNQVEHYDLVKKFTKVRLNEIKEYILNIQFMYLRRSLDEKNPIQFFLLKNIITTKIKLGYSKHVWRTIIGFITYKFFKKGYRYLNI